MAGEGVDIESRDRCPRRGLSYYPVMYVGHLPVILGTLLIAFSFVSRRNWDHRCGLDSPRVYRIQEVEEHCHRLARFCRACGHIDHCYTCLASGMFIYSASCCSFLYQYLVVLFSQRKNKTGMSITDDLINKIIACE